MPLEINLGGKVALVTGVTNGIGAGVARQLARAGAVVAGCGRSRPESESARAFVQAAEAEGSRAAYRQSDVCDPDDLAAMVEGAVSQFGGIDILVSNAGVNIFAGAECTEADWQRNLNLNLASHWRLAKLCRPHLAKRGGVIEIMTSNHAFATMPGCFPYNLAKVALTGLVRSLAIEWGPAIRVVGMAPGFIDTPGNDKWFATFPDPAAERARTIALHPAGRLGTPEEIGGWCAFLASGFAAFATGTTFLIDGGRLAILQDDP